MKIIFMGIPDFAQKSLESVYNAGYEIIGVVTNPDKPKGRGMKLTFSPVKEFAVENGLQVYQPTKVRGNVEFIEKIKALNPDVICVVAYGKILPKEILEIPKYGCINVHGSLLPQYRGAAPIQWAILNGDTKTGITTMYMDEGMDTGDMIFKEEVEIGENETTGELWEKLENVGGKLLVKTLQAIEKGEAPREKQGKDYTMAPMLDKKMSKINWKEQTAVEIKNLVRGLNPIMGAYTYLNGKKIKFWKVDTVKKEIKPEYMRALANGTIIISDAKEGLYVRTKKGILKILEIQGENAKRMPVEDFLRGNPIEPFDVFE